MPSPAPWRHIALLGPALLVIGLGAACTGNDEAYTAPHEERAQPDTWRPSLEPLLYPGATIPEETRTQIPFPEDVTSWSPKGKPCRTEEKDGLRILKVDPGEEGLLLDIRGEFHSTRVNRIQIRGVFGTAHKVTIELQGPDGYRHRDPTLRTRGQEAEQTLTFDLRKMVGRRITFNRLLVHCGGTTRSRFQLNAIELVHKPRHSFLPSPGEPPASTDAAGHSRRAVGLIPARGARCEFDAVQGAQFSCALLAPVHLGPKGGKPLVSITLSSEGGPTQTLEAQVSPHPHPWTVPTCSLDPWAGSRVQADFRYISDLEDPGVIALAEVEVWRPRESPPCVLFVSSDTHRSDHLGAAQANVDIQTPSLDALALDGVLYEDCWASTNVTSPSHVALMTGRHPRDTRLISNIDRLSPDATTLAEVYQRAGWKTVAVVSVSHLGPRGTDLGQGFDQLVYPQADPWPAGHAVDLVEEWVDAYPNRPLFLFLHLFDAHHPYAPPESHDRMYYPAGADPTDPSLPALQVQPPYIPGDILSDGIRDLDFPRAQYRAEISYLDNQLGPLFERERIQAGLIAVTADHGEILEKAGSYFNHGELFPDTLHVPLILGGHLVPEEYRGVRVGNAVDHLNLGRTLLDLSGLGGAEFPGTNLLRDAGAASSGQAALDLFAISAHGYSASIRRGRWFLLLHMHTHKGNLVVERMKHAVELFDLMSDPECLEDVAAVQVEQAEILRTALVAWLAEASSEHLSEQKQTSEAEIAQLEAMGYATEATVVTDEPWYTPDEK
ncbi:MAG: sulfatase-like hydrolase/transferase [Planctomycetota bacterium]|nr:sulfatase-like hydrolase/transferase [Planctomycetota bacterium]